MSSQHAHAFFRPMRTKSWVVFYVWHGLPSVFTSCIDWLIAFVEFVVILTISFYAITRQNPCKLFLPFLVSPRLSCTKVLPLCTFLSCRKELLNCWELRPPKTNTTKKKVSVVFYTPRTERRHKREKKTWKRRTRQKKLKVTSKLAHISVAIRRKAQIRFRHVQSRQETISIKLWSQLTFYHAH